MAESDEDEKVVRPFAAFLQELNKGRVHEELSQGLHDLLAAVKATGKKGSLTLTLVVSQEKKTPMLIIDDDVTPKLPKPDRTRSLWFVDKDGNPTRSDPNQLDFNSIQAVPTPVPAEDNTRKEAN